MTEAERRTGERRQPRPMLDFAWSEGLQHMKASGYTGPFFVVSSEGIVAVGHAHEGRPLRIQLPNVQGL